MKSENHVSRVVRAVTAVVQRALGKLGHPAGTQHARPKLESRNGYGAPKTGERPSKRA